MHNIIILGGNSFLGKRLIADLSNLKINVVATTRSCISNINNDSDYIDWKTCDPVNKYQLASLVNNGDVVINLIYLILIIPPIFMMKNGIFCKYYSIIFFIFYFLSYILIDKKNQ